jgi:hypothetical protein
MALPSFDFGNQDVTLTAPAIQTLAADHAVLDRSHAQPTGVSSG